MTQLRALVAAVKNEEKARDRAKWYACIFAPFHNIRVSYFQSCGPVAQKVIYTLLLAGQVALSGTSTYFSSTHTDLWLRVLYVSVTVSISVIAAIPIVFSKELGRL
jgi:hypothetical protein